MSETKTKWILLVISGALLFAMAVWLTSAYVIDRQSKKGLPDPIEIKNTTDRIKANAVQWYTFTLPYEGTLTVSVQVQKGNELDVFLMREDQLAHFKSKNKFNHFPQFESKQSQNYQRHGNLSEGRYSLVVRDPSYGIISSSTTDYQIKIKLEP